MKKVKQILKWIWKHKILSIIIFILLCVVIYYFRNSVGALIFTLGSILTAGIVSIFKKKSKKNNDDNIIDKIEENNKNDKEYVEDTNNYLDDISNGKFRKNRRSKKDT
jgi:c-di-AMP phosphodiesterase-like protein